MKKIIISLLAFAGLAFSAINMAVIDTEVDASAPDLQNELKESELRYITQEIRRQAKNSLSDDYNIMTEQSVMVLGDAVLQECAEENCMVAYGEKIGADYITRGTISKFRDKFTLIIEVYETKKGMLIVSSDPVEDGDFSNFIPKIRETTPAMFKKLMEIMGKKQAGEQEKEKQLNLEQRHKENFEKIKIGIRAGFSLYLYSDDSTGYDMGKGFGGGLTVRIPFKSWLFLNPGVDFYYRELFGFSWEDGKGDMSELTISIPVMLQFMLAETFYLSVGPQLDIPVKSELKYEDKIYDSGRANFDIDLAFGFGYMIIPSLSADFKAVMNTMPIFNGNGIDYDKKYGSLIQLGVGVTYFF
jgi:hypothetical protein